jgi:hypothetical protein
MFLLYRYGAAVRKAIDILEIPTIVSMKSPVFMTPYSLAFHGLFGLTYRLRRQRQCVLNKELVSTRRCVRNVSSSLKMEAVDATESA